MKFLEFMDKNFADDLNARSRYITIRPAIKLFLERGGKNIIETGTARGYRGFEDGNSTLIWSHLANAVDGKCYSVDISKEAIRGSMLLCEGVSDNTIFKTMDSLNFLQEFDDKIDLLYLDSMDASVGGYQKHHLEEIKLAHSNLHENSIILIDDSPEYETEYLKNGGKGALVIPLLLENGWKILLRNYQTLLIRDETYDSDIP